MFALSALLRLVEMTRLAVSHGMRTVLSDGIYKAVESETTLDEVLRATATWL